MGSKPPGFHRGPVKPARWKKNLLELAMNFERPAWSAAEKHEVWRHRRYRKLRAYLEERGGYIILAISGVPDTCVIWWLDPITQVWRENPRVYTDYRAWRKIAEPAYYRLKRYYQKLEEYGNGDETVFTTLTRRSLRRTSKGSG
jgi:hypothetical protein